MNLEKYKDSFVNRYTCSLEEVERIITTYGFDHIRKMLEPSVTESINRELSEINDLVVDEEAKPETLLDILKDAQLPSENYWNCPDYCEDCRAKINGKTPWERYDTIDCYQVILFDAKRRIEALYERKSGEE